ncbi:LytR/AlgR family response regulator transcription factor [Noviherbaspirillum sp.]|uniref:LytR/AlgR family response regulator transcription factor n=1 Tax=Noviherbaspirillum sp. TaxID=1926288 RepID=UPI002FE2CFD3
MIPRLYIVDDEAPARSRLKTLLADIAGECPHELVGEASHAQGALDGIAASRPDLVLMDVQMPGMTGIELAAHLQKQSQPSPAVVFVTAYDAYALQAFEVHALDYLLKPVRARRLADAIRHAISRRIGQDVAISAASAKAGRQHFSVQERGRVLLVPISDVVYLKAELKYVTLRTRACEYLLEESLTSIEEELGNVFVRVHRNALVSRSAIVGVERASVTVDAEGDQEKAQEPWQVILRDVNERLPISRRQWPVVKALVK